MRTSGPVVTKLTKSSLNWQMSVLTLVRVYSQDVVSVYAVGKPGFWMWVEFCEIVALQPVSLDGTY